MDNIIKQLKELNLTKSEWKKVIGTSIRCLDDKLSNELLEHKPGKATLSALANYIDYVHDMDGECEFYIEDNELVHELYDDDSDIRIPGDKMRLEWDKDNDEFYLIDDNTGNKYKCATVDLIRELEASDYVIYKYL